MPHSLRLPSGRWDSLLPIEILLTELNLHCSSEHESWHLKRAVVWTPGSGSTAADSDDSASLASSTAADSEPEEGTEVIDLLENLRVMSQASHSQARAVVELLQDRDPHVRFTIADAWLKMHQSGDAQVQRPTRSHLYWIGPFRWPISSTSRGRVAASTSGWRPKMPWSRWPAQRLSRSRPYERSCCTMAMRPSAGRHIARWHGRGRWASCWEDFRWRLGFGLKRGLAVHSSKSEFTVASLV
mmetsp:Transcript_131787/g.421847  ORF Transcript_131787/g.421847 Transcript_131787/m.421847 type:complete len:242 (+) Transcript_131787:317-1042(+)